MESVNTATLREAFQESAAGTEVDEGRRSGGGVGASVVHSRSTSSEGDGAGRRAGGSVVLVSPGQASGDTNHRRNNTPEREDYEIDIIDDYEGRTAADSRRTGADTYSSLAAANPMFVPARECDVVAMRGCGRVAYAESLLVPSLPGQLSHHRRCDDLSNE